MVDGNGGVPGFEPGARCIWCIVSEHPGAPDTTQRTVAERDIYTFGTNLIVKMLENERQRHTEMMKIDRGVPWPCGC